MPDKARHPMQPVEWDGQGVVRFKSNAIVRHLLDESRAGRKTDLNDLARHQPSFSREDWVQFAQLIGYSVSGWSDLSYVSDDDYRGADLARDTLLNEQPEDPDCPRKEKGDG